MRIQYILHLQFVAFDVKLTNFWPEYDTCKEASQTYWGARSGIFIIGPYWYQIKQTCFLLATNAFLRCSLKSLIFV